MPVVFLSTWQHSDDFNRNYAAPLRLTDFQCTLKVIIAQLIAKTEHINSKPHLYLFLVSPAQDAVNTNPPDPDLYTYGNLLPWLLTCLPSYYGILLPWLLTCLPSYYGILLPWLLTCLPSYYGILLPWLLTYLPSYYGILLPWLLTCLPSYYGIMLPWLLTCLPSYYGIRLPWLLTCLPPRSSAVRSFIKNNTGWLLLSQSRCHGNKVTQPLVECDGRLTWGNEVTEYRVSGVWTSRAGWSSCCTLKCDHRCI